MISDPEPGRHFPLALGPSDVSHLYAADLLETNGGNKHKVEETKAKVIAGAQEKMLVSKDLSEDFKATVAELGVAVFFDTFYEPASYTYNDRLGVRIVPDDKQKFRSVLLTPEELRVFRPGKAIDVLPSFEEAFRKKFKSVEPATALGN